MPTERQRSLGSLQRLRELMRNVPAPEPIQEPTDPRLTTIADRAAENVYQGLQVLLMGWEVRNVGMAKLIVRRLVQKLTSRYGL